MKFGAAAVSALINLVVCTAAKQASAAISADATNIMNIAVQLQNLAPPLAAAISATSPNVATIKSMVSTLQTVTTSYVAAANTIQTDAAADCASDSALVSEIANLQAHNAHFMSYVSGLAGSIFRDKFVQSTSVADMAYVSDNAGEITIIPQLIINRLPYC